MSKTSKQQGKRKKEQLEFPVFVTDGVKAWTLENGSMLKSLWRRAELGYDLRQAVDANNADKAKTYLLWGQVALSAGEDRSSLNDDVSAMTLVQACGLKVAELPSKGYSLFVKMQRLKTSSIQVVKKSSLQSKEMEAAIAEVEKLVNGKARQAAAKRSPVRLPDVQALLDQKLVELGVRKSPTAPVPIESFPIPKVDVRNLGLLDTATFLDLLKQEFESPTYRGCSVGVASATLEDLDEASVSAALDELKETAFSIIPPHGDVWLRLQRRQVAVADNQPEAAA